MSEKISFLSFIELAEKMVGEGVQRPLLSAQLMSPIERKPCGEIKIPMRDQRDVETDGENSQIAKKLSFNFGSSLKLSSTALAFTQEALDNMNEQLKREAMERLEHNLRQLCIPLNGPSLAQKRLPEEVERSVASIARRFDISPSDAFDMCNRFLSEHSMPWEVFTRFVANGLIGRSGDGLVLVMAIPALPLRRGGDTNSIGDTTCKYNARSPHIRCAVNPCGPCDNCNYREAHD